MKWNTIDDFLEYHHDIIRKLVEGCFRETYLRDQYYNKNTKEIETVRKKLDIGTITRLSFELWKQSRVFSNRQVFPLCFDCCYLIMKATGNKVSIPELEMVGLEAVGNPVTALKWRKERWFESEKGKQAILNVLSDGDSSHPSFILELYEDLIER